MPRKPRGEAVTPGKAAAPPRKVKIIFGVTPEQRKEIQEAARRKGQTMTDHIIQVAIPNFYAVEKFEGAIHDLATGEGRLADRLAGAWIHNLSAVEPEKDIPEHLRKDFLAIRDALTKRASKGDGTLLATTEHMRKAEARRIAGLMYDLNDKLQEWSRE